MTAAASNESAMATRAAGLTLHAPKRRRAEESPGPQQQDEDHETEAEDLTDAGSEIPGHDRLEDPVKETGHDDASRAFHAADDGNGERLEADRRTHRGRNVQQRREEHAGHAGEKRRQRVGDRDRAIDVDTHETGRLVAEG